MCICYSSKHEIFEAMDGLSKKIAKGEAEATREDFEKELYGGMNVAPDILIRTSNEIRMSNFLLYQTDES